ncbi:MAG: SPOR domain-containing protein [Leptolyngbyaceae cyanobacterium bins.59]|nr:SPOR domain-containing protein [Leptolyngbyaceae cyanobacterium bins.59]
MVLLFFGSTSSTQALNFSQNYGSSGEEAPIILGQPCDNSYVVAIPTRNFQLLDQVQTIVPTAFLTRIWLGFYIQAGSYAQRSPAETLTHQLRERGFDARVIYKPVDCSFYLF